MGQRSSGTTQRSHTMARFQTRGLKTAAVKAVNFPPYTGGLSALSCCSTAAQGFAELTESGSEVSVRLMCEAVPSAEKTQEVVQNQNLFQIKLHVSHAAFIDSVGYRAAILAD